MMWKVIAGLAVAGWAATCVEGARRDKEQLEALKRARRGLSLGYQFSLAMDPRDMTGSGARRDRHEIAVAANMVSAALERRSR